MGIDQQIFEWINGLMLPSGVDTLLIYIRNKYVWIPIYLFILAFVLMNLKSTRWYYILALLACVSVADITSAKVLKPIIGRERPCKQLDTSQITLRVRCGSGKSFPSNHAANHFALSCFLIFSLGADWRLLKMVLLLWATAVSFAQVYVGVHYLSDVIGGAALGCIIAIMINWLYTLWSLKHAKSTTPA